MAEHEHRLVRHPAPAFSDAADVYSVFPGAGSNNVAVIMWQIFSVYIYSQTCGCAVDRLLYTLCMELFETNTYFSELLNGKSLKSLNPLKQQLR